MSADAVDLFGETSPNAPRKKKDVGKKRIANLSVRGFGSRISPGGRNVNVSRRKRLNPPRRAVSF